ncbi:HlyD family type I secretion periplasmic adaptor subunit [Devosia marina]|uniref:Membrane fusion protein (MFP) family protein n=1 Tax=Devosia marina TaxID=2683198 RepID=A0A7X3FQC7_9HYPH|nr:HlyD family type I secretion periplasmic adaptor subunit [Devosia marina]MVS98834.1 HlyD family type I secretion periplasmic adaptor subunit [Devosia marina]
MTSIDAAGVLHSSSSGLDRKGRDPAQFSMRGRVIWGTLFAIALVGGLGGWASTARLSGAVIGQGTVQIDEDLKVVQHVDGGVVREIRVKVGERVVAGQVLLRLDATQARSEHSILSGQIIELEARRFRLLAERDDLIGLDVPTSFREQTTNSQIAVDEETQLFDSNLAFRNTQLDQMQLQLSQLQQEIVGLEAQQTATASELELASEERTRLRELASGQLVETSRLTVAERDMARLEGQMGEVSAAIARAKSRISELQLRIMGMDSDRRTVAQRELRAVDAQLAELRERLNAAAARLARVEILAPTSGVVNELNVSTLGGVISPAERLLTIVPDDALLTIEFRVAVTDIDQVTVGKEVSLRFSAFNQRVTPEFDGVVTRVAAAAQIDHASGQPFYTADVEVSDDAANFQLVPGMPVEVFVTTEEQLAIAYFMKPFTDQISRAFREE